MKKFLILSFLLLIWGNSFAQEQKLTDEKYYLEYIEQIEETQSYLTYMNNKSALAKIGTETINGKISGTLFYTVKIKGLGAEVILKYDNLCNEEGWIFDGSIIVTSDMLSNGNISGTITVSGNKPAIVYYDGVEMKKGDPAAGCYGVQQEGQPRGEVPYTVYLNWKQSKSNKS